MLAKSGYWSGNPDFIRNAEVSRVMQAYHYETYLRDYESTYYELNRERKK